MYHKTIFHTLPDGVKAKFTIRDRIINGEVFYYANIINIELDVYINLPNDMARDMHYGIEITNGKQQKINYRDVDRLINDILTKYGNEWLDTEI
jgi:hypothetical protein